MSSSRPYTTHQSYQEWTDPLDDTLEDACKCVANTDNSKTSDWITPILAKHSKEAEWKSVIQLHQALRTEANSWTKTPASIKEATQAFALSLSDLRVSEDCHRDIQNLICLFKGLYARAVWLDHGRKWEPGQDPLAEGNRARVPGGTRENIYAHLWEASLILEDKLKQFLENEAATPVVMNTTAIFSQMLREDEISLTSFSIATTQEEGYESRSTSPSHSLSSKQDEPHEEIHSEPPKAEPFKSEAAQRLDQVITFRIIELMACRDQLSEEGKDKSKRALLDQLISVFALNQATLSLPNFPDAMVKTVEDSLSRIMKTYIKDLAKLNLFNANTGPEIKLLQKIRADLKLNTDPLNLQQHKMAKDKKPSF